MGDTDSVRLRGGLVLGREIINDDGSKFRGYVKASIQHEFDEKTDIWLDRRLFVSGPLRHVGEATAWGSSTGRSTVSLSSSISNTAAARNASSRGPCSSATG